MRRRRRLFVWLRAEFGACAALAALLAACASEAAPFVLPPDHPASPSADEAPVPLVSTTLATEGPEAPRAESNDTPDAMKGHHDFGAHDAAQGDGKPTPADKAEGVQQAYTCPMHVDVVSTEPSTCPKCGMRLKKQPDPPHHDGGAR